MGGSLGRIARVVPLDPVQIVKADLLEVDRAPGSAALVAAVHVVEYLDGGTRAELYRRCRRWLAPGGRFFLVVHLARGPRFERLVGGFDNISVDADDRRVRLTMTDMVPGREEAEQVQRFFRAAGLRQELDAAGFTAAAGCRCSQAIHVSPSGLVEAVVEIETPAADRRSDDGPPSH